MSTPDFELDEHLQALFGALDTRADFDARLMARLHAEAPTVAAERALRARRERARYRSTILELQNWRRSMLRQATLDTLGIALLLVVVGVTAWPHVSVNVMNIWRQYGLYLAMMLSIVIAALPLLGMWAEQTRRPIRLL